MESTHIFKFTHIYTLVGISKLVKVLGTNSVTNGQALAKTEKCGTRVKSKKTRQKKAALWTSFVFANL